MIKLRSHKGWCTPPSLSGQLRFTVIAEKADGKGENLMNENTRVFFYGQNRFFKGRLAMSSAKTPSFVHREDKHNLNCPSGS